MIRKESIKFKVLRNGAEYAEIFAKGNPTLRCSSSGEIKVSMSGEFFPYALDSRKSKVSVDWVSDEIQPVLVLDGIETALAIMMPAKTVPTENETDELLKVEAYDRCWRIRDTKAETPVYFAADTNYIDNVEQLLTASGINTTISTPTTLTLPEAREWEIGTSYLSIVNELLKEINYQQVWFNHMGVAVLEPISIPTAANVKHFLSNKKKKPNDPKSHGIISLKPGIRRATDIYSAANVFVAVCANPDKSSTFIARAENNNANSPLSTVRRGRRIVSYEKLDNIASQAALEAYVENKRNQSLLSAETIEVQTNLMPGFGVNDVVSLEYGDETSLCVEEAWTMELVPGGTMTHEMKKVVYNID